MRAAVLNDDHELVVAEVADPSPGPGELVLEVTACGICGSDLKLRAVDARRPRDGPRVLRRGRRRGRRHRSGVAHRSPRDRAPDHSAAASAWPASPVNPRTASRPTTSASAEAPARSPSTYGSHQRETVGLPESIDPALGALVEPLAVGLHAVERAHIRSGDKVLVVGAGPVGLSVIAWAARSGAGELVVSDPSAVRRDGRRAVRRHPHRRSRSRSRSSRATTSSSSASAVPGLTDVCVGASTRHGHVVIAGVCTKPDPYVPVMALMKELTMDFVVYYTRREFFSVVDALAQGAVDAAPFVTRRVGLEGANDAFTELIEAKDQRKILVLP